MRMLAVGLAIGLIVEFAALGFCAVPPPVRPPSLGDDTRLQGRAAVAVPGRAISALLETVGDATGVELSADETCGDQKVIFFGRSRRIGEVLELLGTHFDFRWSRISGAGNETSSPGYRLMAVKRRRALAGQLRVSAERERSQRIARRLEKRLRYLDAPRETLTRLGANDPYFDTSPLNAGLRARFQLVLLLPAAVRREVAAGQPYVSPPLTQLSPATQALVLLAGGLTHRVVDPSQLRFTFCRESAEGADHLVVRVIGPEGRPLGASSDLIPTDPPRREAAVPFVPDATDPSRKPAGLDLERSGELLDEKGQPLMIQAGLPALLAGFARATELDVLSDYYAGQTPRFEMAALGKRPLWQLLSVVAAQYCLKWERRGSLLVFRHQEWFEVEAEEIPERLFRSCVTEKPLPERIALDDFINLLSALTPEQLRGVRFQFRNLILTPPYAWERWLASLDAAQRDALVEGRELPGDDLGTSSRQQLVALLSPLADNALKSIRMRVENHVITISVEGSGVREYSRWQIPLKASAPAAVLFKVLGAR